MDDTSSRKRPRPVVSCLRCRDKKLKCDRTAPCLNCIKASTANTCTYNRNGISPGHSKQEQSQSTPAANSAPFNSLEDLQYRMAKVEELLGVARSHQNSATSSRVEKPAPTTPLPTLGTVVVKGNRSHYHGQNDRVTLLNQFVEVKDYINDRMVRDDQLLASAKQIKFLQEKTQPKIASSESRNSSGFSLALVQLEECLPPKTYCDRLVSIYFRFFERTMRVLHGPTFMRQYEQIWSKSDPNACNPFSIIPQLTAVMTMAYHMDDAVPENDEQAHRTYLKEAATDLIQTWLDELGRKHRKELPTLQVEILLLLSQTLRHFNTDKLWSSTGALVRSAMIMGLHIDPTSMSGVTPFQIEMWRRLWATILEMDLQGSMAAGMPLVVPKLDSYNLVPANLNDLDFDESSTKLPTSRPLNSLTDSLYQVCLATSLPQRLKALSLVQRSAPTTEEAIALGRKVEECLSRKPSVLSLQHNNVTPSDESALLHRVLLDLFLRRPLLCLYKPLLLADQRDHTTFTEVQKHCLSSSLAILSYQDLYTTQAVGTTTANPLPQQDFFYQCCKVDILWAALTICQHIKLFRQAATTDQPLDDEIGHDETSLIQTVQDTISHLIARIGRKGGDLKDIVFLALALKSVQLSESSPERTDALHRSTRKILAACLERLLQPMVLQEHSQPPHHRPVKRVKTTAHSAPLSETTPNLSNSMLTSALLSEPALPMGLPEHAEQWFGELPDLAAEFTNFQQEIYAGTGSGSGVGDAFNFGIGQEWNWENMWQ